jgi:hypothetical protein
VLKFNRKFRRQRVKYNRDLMSDWPSPCTELHPSFIWYAGSYMFRHSCAIFRELFMSSWVTWKQKRLCRLSCTVNVVGTGHQHSQWNHDSWQQWKDHNLYTPTTQSIAWVAYTASTTPWRWQPFAETCRGRIWNALIKSITSLRHLLVISHKKLRYTYNGDAFAFNNHPNSRI